MAEDPNAPRNLEKLFGQIKGMARQAVRRGRRRAINGKSTLYRKHPRQVCDICFTLHDYALIHQPKKPEFGRCRECKQKLSDGWTAVIALNGHAFIKGQGLNPGEIIRVSQDTMDQLQKKVDNTQHGPRGC